MDIKLIRNFEEGRYCSVSKELLLQMIDDNYRLGRFNGKKIFMFNPVTNERFEVMPEVSKYDLSKIRFGVNEHDYIMFTSARLLNEREVEILFYWYISSEDRASIVHTQTVELEKLGTEICLKTFVLDENYCLFETIYSGSCGIQYELILHDIKNDKDLRIENPMLVQYGIDKIIPLGGNQCAIKIGSSKIGVINVKQFVSEIVLGLDNIYIDILDEEKEPVILPYMRKYDTCLVYSKMDLSSKSEEVIIYDYENKVKKVRFNSSMVNGSDLNNTYIINGVPFMLKVTDKSTRLVNLNTQKTDIRLSADVRVRYVRGDLIVTQRHVKKVSFMRKENYYIEVFRFPDMHHAVFKTRGKYEGCVVHFDDLLIFTNKAGGENGNRRDN